MTNNIHEIYAYLCVQSVDDAVAFYNKAFGAREHYRLTEPGGRVGHAEMFLGSGAIMLSEEFPEMGICAPIAGAPASFSIHLHVDKVDDMLAAAVSAGAEVLRPAEDQFYGERSATLNDPFGYRWMLGHTVEDVSTAEMQTRYNKLFEVGSA